MSLGLRLQASVFNLLFYRVYQLFNFSTCEIFVKITFQTPSTQIIRTDQALVFRLVVIYLSFNVGEVLILCFASTTTTTSTSHIKENSFHLHTSPYNVSQPNHQHQEEDYIQYLHP